MTSYLKADQTDTGHAPDLTLTKPFFKLIVCLWLTTAFAGCEPEHHYEVLTPARVTLAAPDNIRLLQAAGTVSMQSLTNKFTWTEKQWDSISVVFPQVLCGKVAVSINGGRRRVYRFRAANSYVEVLDRPTEVKLDIQLFK